MLKYRYYYTTNPMEKAILFYSNFSGQNQRRTNSIHIPFPTAIYSDRRGKIDCISVRAMPKPIRWQATTKILAVRGGGMDDKNEAVFSRRMADGNRTEQTRFVVSEFSG